MSFSPNILFLTEFYEKYHLISRFSLYILGGFLAHKRAVFEPRPAFPGVIFCKIQTQSPTKGYMHGHLNTHVKSHKTADHRSRPTIKNKELGHAF